MLPRQKTMQQPSPAVSDQTQDLAAKPTEWTPLWSLVRLFGCWPLANRIYLLVWHNKFSFKTLCCRHKQERSSRTYIGSLSVLIVIIAPEIDAEGRGWSGQQACQEKSGELHGSGRAMRTMESCCLKGRYGLLDFLNLRNSTRSQAEQDSKQTFIYTGDCLLDSSTNLPTGPGPQRGWVRKGLRIHIESRKCSWYTQEEIRWRELSWTTAEYISRLRPSI